MSGFPDLDHFKVPRSFDVPGAATLPNGANDAVESLSDAQNPAHDWSVDQLSGHAQRLSQKLKSRLPDYYVVGLRGYCEGVQHKASFLNCSGTSNSFSFSLFDVMDSQLDQAQQLEELLPTESQTFLKGYRQASEWTISAFILALISASLTVSAGILSLMFSWGKLVTIVCSIVCLTHKVLPFCR